jgi:hypothetical protein
VKPSQMEEAPLAPTYLINQVVVHTNTGRKGTIRSIVYHKSRCWHAEFQPHARGTRGGLAKVEDINLDYLEGALIDKWQKERDAAIKAAVKESVKEAKPAPAPRSPGGMDGGPMSSVPESGVSFR